MVNRTLIDQILSLSPADRLELISEIWDSMMDHPEAIELTEAQKLELDRRFEDYRKNPQSARSWEEVRDRLARRP